MGRVANSECELANSKQGFRLVGHYCYSYFTIAAPSGGGVP